MPSSRNGVPGWIVEYRHGGAPGNIPLADGAVALPAEQERTTAAPLLAVAASGGARIPAVAAEGPSAAVFAGRLFNRDELERAYGSGAEAGNDATVVLRAFLRWGPEAVARLWGEFALICLDGREGVLLAATDPIGTVPLVYAATASGIVFSDNPEAIAGQFGVAREVNRGLLAARLCDVWTSVEETCYRGVRQVPPAHRLEVRRGRFDLVRYWNPVPPGGRIEWASDEEVASFPAALERAIEVRVRGRRPAIFLSAGLDSVSVAAVAVGLAAKNASPKPLGLSLRFPHPDCDEGDTQRAIARALGIEHVMLGLDEAVGDGGCLRAAAELSETLPSPLLNIWQPAYQRLAREGAARGADLILTGTGGDEWLGVSPFLAADLIRAGNLPGLVHLVASSLRSFPVPALANIRFICWACGLRPLLAGPARRLAIAVAPSWVERRRSRRRARWPTWLSPAPEVRTDLERRSGSDFGRNPTMKSLYAAEMERCLRLPLVALELEETYRLATATGIAVSSPFLDSRLLELLIRVPPRALTAGGRHKSLLRDVVRSRLPDLEIHRQKKLVATSFFIELVASGYPELWDEHRRTPAVARFGIADEERLQEWVSRGVGSSGGSALGGRDSHLLWMLLSCDRWLEAREESAAEHA